MLLSERCENSGAEPDDVVNSSSSKEAAMRFIESITNTRLLSRPKYINVTCASEQQQRRDLPV